MIPNSSTSPFALTSRRVVTAEGVREAAVLIRDEKIVGLCPLPDVPSGYDVRDCGSLVIMPGLVDPHVHINEPGRTEWEGFETATRAAAAGGVTTIVDMPLNSTPVTTTVDALRLKQQATDGALTVDCGFYGGLVPGSEQNIEGLAASGVFGIKAFLIDSGIDDFPAVGENTLATAMSVIANSRIPLLAHAEIRSPVDHPEGEAPDWTQYQTYLHSRPPTWETTAVAMLIKLCLRYRCPVHIVHLATADALEIIQEARSQGAPLTVETCPHYLYFDAESIPRGQTLLKCAPPIRDRANNDRLFQALLDGDIDFIASDHSPTVPSAKAIDTGNFAAAWGGIASMQLRLPVMWTLARTRGATLMDLSKWLAQRPAEFLGIGHRKGTIQSGGDADLTVWDPEARFTVSREMLHDRHRLSPYEGRDLYGSVIATYLRGNLVYEVGRFGRPTGQVITYPPPAY